MTTERRPSMPPLFLTSTLLFWSWRTDLRIFGIVMGPLLELPALTVWRWNFSVREFQRVADGCALLFLGMAVWLLVTTPAFTAVFTLLSWLPIALFPLIACQVFSVEGRVDIRAISFFFRHQIDTHLLPPPLDLSYPYVVLAVLSASLPNERGIAFFAGAAALLAWGLFPFRARHVRHRIWGAIMVLVIVLGGLGHMGLSRLQRYLETVGMEWFYRIERTLSDPYQTNTALGQIGELKLLDGILFRVTAPPDQTPLLLREASYNRFNGRTWFAGDPDFNKVPQDTGPGADPDSWHLAPEPKGIPAHRITVAEFLPEGRGMVRQPPGTFRVSRLPASELSRNDFEAVKIIDGPALAIYAVDFAGSDPAAAPLSDDLSIPNRELPVMSAITRRMGLEKTTDREVLARVRAFFRDGFTYSLVQSHEGEPTPLGHFLTQRRAGHCEYYASATVLLLRAAGIPARYVTGFVVSEYSSLESMFLVRQRHAHAWATAWIDGAWQDVDTTPSTWEEEEMTRSTIWRPLADFRDWLVFRFQRWRTERRGSGLPSILVWLVVPLVVWLVVRLLRKRRLRTSRPRLRPRSGADKNGPATGAFAAVESRLTSIGWPREPGEPILSWLERLSRRENGPPVETLLPLARRYYALRFDPAKTSLPETESRKSWEEIATDIQQWIGETFLTAGPGA